MLPHHAPAACLCKGLMAHTLHGGFITHMLTCAWGARVLLERLLPALLDAVATTVSDADLRFSCLKVMSDLLALLLDLNADGKSLTSQHSLITGQFWTTNRSYVLLLSI